MVRKASPIEWAPVEQAVTTAGLDRGARAVEEMPGVDIVPDYEARINVMREMGEINRDVFLQKVYFPVLKYLGVTREELVVAAGELRRAAAAAESVALG